jgi:uncharacterized protein (DUF362 family)
MTRQTNPPSRRQFLTRVGAFAAGAALPWRSLAAFADEPAPGKARVAIGRDEALIKGNLNNHDELLQKLLDASMQRLTGKADARAAWRSIFKPADRTIGIKVNTLGLTTSPAVVYALAACLRRAGWPAERLVIWDRFDVELAAAGYKLNRSATGVRCFGTDADRIGSGYQDDAAISGEIGSCFSKIVAEQVDAVISVPVLKDHNLAGVSLGMKNFYGAIHNPNKYHSNNCNPYIADVVAHRFIRDKWRLTVCDAVHAQYHAGPARHPGFAWPFAGLISSTDFVAADAVAANLLEARRKAANLKPLADENRPYTYIATASDRNLGIADLTRIERIEV